MSYQDSCQQKTQLIMWLKIPGAFASCAVCNTVDAADWIFCLDTKQVEIRWDRGTPVKPNMKEQIWLQWWG